MNKYFAIVLIVGSTPIIMYYGSYLFFKAKYRALNEAIQEAKSHG